MLRTVEDVRRHVSLKRDACELRWQWADHMLAALDRGARPDYPALLRAAMFPDPPLVVYHTAPRTQRESIRAAGLRISKPGESPHWFPTREECIAIQGWQPAGVYVGAEPDRRGVWAHWPEWDVWAIERGELPWEHDELNPGCWRLTAPVPPELLTLDGATIGR